MIRPIDNRPSFNAIPFHLLDVAITDLPTENLADVIESVLQNTSDHIAQLLREQAVKAKADMQEAVGLMRAGARRMWLIGTILERMKIVKKHGEYEDWVKNTCKFDVSTGRMFKRFAKRVHIPDLDNYASARQALIATGVRVVRKASGTKTLTVATPPQAPLLLEAPALSKETCPTNLANPTANLGPLSTAATSIKDPDIYAALDQLNQAVTVYGRKEKFQTLSYKELRALKKKMAKLTQFSDKVRWAITYWKFRR